MGISDVFCSQAKLNSFLYLCFLLFFLSVTISFVCVHDSSIFHSGHCVTWTWLATDDAWKCTNYWIVTWRSLNIVTTTEAAYSLPPLPLSPNLKVHDSCFPLLSPVTLVEIFPTVFGQKNVVCSGRDRVLSGQMTMMVLNILCSF